MERRPLKKKIPEKDEDYEEDYEMGSDSGGEWGDEPRDDEGDYAYMRTRSKKKKSKFRDDVYDDEDPKGKKRKGEDKNGKNLKKSAKQSKKEKYGLEGSSGEEGVLIIDDPNSYYDTDEYDSEGKLIRRDELKRQQLEEERMQRKLKRKPNTPHLVKKYIPVKMDKDNKPVFPIQLRGLTIESLGKIVYDRPKFHAKRYIWPVGFKSSRIYNSMTQLDQRCEYTSEIVENGDEPSFIVTCYEDPKNPIVIVRPTASGAWAEVGKKFFELKKEVTGKDTFTQLSGPEMFGFAHPSIAKLIQEMPGADYCEKYVPQQFVPSSAKLKLEDTPTIPVRRSGSSQMLDKSKSKKKSPKMKYDSDTDSEGDYPPMIRNETPRHPEPDDKKEFEAEDAYDIKEDVRDHRPSRSQMISHEKLDEEAVMHVQHQSHSMNRGRGMPQSNWPQAQPFHHAAPANHQMGHPIGGEDDSERDATSS
eukprot:TRINITY_DN4238_c0_g1_i3.p1 TRINITY_DN4238_c0_g1~~TRINITY_DN4238_c0_g1_i3.p1  ORF type:complete len:473 (-),score=137.10 TRINITY_DN4238_c0_g1_i3:531-1949(-)